MMGCGRGSPLGQSTSPTGSPLSPGSPTRAARWVNAMTDPSWEETRTKLAAHGGVLDTRRGEAVWCVLRVVMVLYFCVAVGVSSIIDAYSPYQLLLDGVGTIVFVCDTMAEFSSSYAELKKLKESIHRAKQSGGGASMARRMRELHGADMRRVVKITITTLSDAFSAIPFDIFAWFIVGRAAHRLLYNLRVVKLLKMGFWVADETQSFGSIAYITPQSLVNHTVHVPSLKRFFLVVIVFLALSFIHLGMAVGVESDEQIDITHPGRAVDDSFYSVYYVMYSVLGIGYGDMVLNSLWKQAFSSLLCVLSPFAEALIIGWVVGVITSDSIQSRQKGRILSTLRIMRLYTIPKQLASEVLSFQHHLCYFKACPADLQVLGGLPLEMQSHLSHHVKMNLLTKVGLFNTTAQENMSQLARILTSEVFAAGQYIARAGEAAEEMYFLCYGYVDVFGEKEPLRTLKGGSYFGEECLAGVRIRNYSAVALTYCDCYRMRADDFFDVSRQTTMWTPSFRHKYSLSTASRAASVACDSTGSPARELNRSTVSDGSARTPSFAPAPQPKSLLGRIRQSIFAPEPLGVDEDAATDWVEGETSASGSRSLLFAAGGERLLNMMDPTIVTRVRHTIVKVEGKSDLDASVEAPLPPRRRKQSQAPKGTFDELGPDSPDDVRGSAALVGDVRKNERETKLAVNVLANISAEPGVAAELASDEQHNAEGEPPSAAGLPTCSDVVVTMEVPDPVSDLSSSGRAPSKERRRSSSTSTLPPHPPLPPPPNLSLTQATPGEAQLAESAGPPSLQLLDSTIAGSELFVTVADEPDGDDHRVLGASGSSATSHARRGGAESAKRTSFLDHDPGEKRSKRPSVTFVGADSGNSKVLEGSGDSQQQQGSKRNSLQMDSFAKRDARPPAFLDREPGGSVCSYNFTDRSALKLAGSADARPRSPRLSATNPFGHMLSADHSGPVIPGRRNSDVQSRSSIISLQEDLTPCARRFGSESGSFLMEDLTSAPRRARGSPAVALGDEFKAAVLVLREDAEQLAVRLERLNSRLIASSSVLGSCSLSK